MTNDISKTEHTEGTDHLERAQHEDRTTPDALLIKLRLGLEVTVLAACVYAAWTARSFPELASSFPFYAALAGAVLTLVVIVQDVRRDRSRRTRSVGAVLDISSVIADAGTAAEARMLLARTGLYAGWVVGFLVLIALVGFLAATAVFIAAFLIVEGAVRPLRALASAGLAAAVLLLVADLMDMGLPSAFWQ